MMVRCSPLDGLQGRTYKQVCAEYAEVSRRNNFRFNRIEANNIGYCKINLYFLTENISALSKNIVQDHNLNHSLDISQVFNMQKTRTNRGYHKH